MPTCEATRSDGTPCQAPAQAGSDYCYWHDPETRNEMLAASRRGGQTRTRPVALPIAPPLSPETARGALAAAVEAVAAGSMDAGTARTIGYLVGIDAKMREAEEVEKRLEALERAAALSAGT